MPPQTASEQLRAKLKLKQLQTRKQFALAKPLAHQLLAAKQFDLKKLPPPAHLLAGAALTGTLLLTPASASTSLPEKSVEERLAAGLSTQPSLGNWLASRLQTLLPATPGHLTAENETKASILIRSAYGVNAVPEIEGHRLNHSFGWTGYEQHLRRYPGDTLSQHDEERLAGIAPGRGGWGYFTYSKAQLTPEDILREKYYFAVQTLYLSNWRTDTQALSKWYKYRKMIMINPQNGKAVVGVVADGGPARWTGKHFGGSPEIMKALELHTASRKGHVLLYFVDDPQNRIPLGPIQYNLNQPTPIRT